MANGRLAAASEPSRLFKMQDKEEKRMAKTAIIVGAGPAGLTAAYELLQRTDIKPVILEKSDYIGGLSRTGFFQSLTV